MNTLMSFRSTTIVFTLACLSFTSCVFSPSVPPEEYYARNYGDIERPVEVDVAENLIEDDERGIGGEPESPFELDTEQEAALSSETYASSEETDPENTAYADAPEEPEELDAVDDGVPTLITETDELAALQTGEGQMVEKLPHESPLKKAGGATEFRTLEEKLFALITTSFNDRDPLIFPDAYTKFVRLYPNSRHLDAATDYRNRFYLRETLNTEHFADSILNLGYLRDDDYPLLDKYFSRARQAGFEYILWKPFVNIADYSSTPPPKKGDVGALYRGNVIQMYENRMPQVIESAKKHNLKILISFPLRDHPWVKYNKKRLPEDTWFPGGSVYGMHASLNLIHPEIRVYLKDLLREIVNYDVDGIVFENDFTHHLFEGFHELNLLIYEDEVHKDNLKKNSARYNKNEQPRTYFKGNIYNKYENNFAYRRQLQSDRYQNYATWRSNRIARLLQALIGDLKMMNANLYVGVKTAPALITDRSKAIRDYGTAPEFIFNLPTDFIILDKGLYGTKGVYDYPNFEKSIHILAEDVDENKSIYLNNTPDRIYSAPLFNRNTEKIERFRLQIAAKGLLVGKYIGYLRNEFLRPENAIGLTARDVN